jgi:hypothetical protein
MKYIGNNIFNNYMQATLFPNTKPSYKSSIANCGTYALRLVICSKYWKSHEVEADQELPRHDYGHEFLLQQHFQSSINVKHDKNKCNKNTDLLAAQFSRINPLFYFGAGISLTESIFCFWAGISDQWNINSAESICCFLAGISELWAIKFGSPQILNCKPAAWVFVRPPDAGKDFRMSNNTVWNCQLLLYIYIPCIDCAFVSVLWECDKDPPGAELVEIYLIILILEVLHRVALACRSRIAYECLPDYKVLNVLSVESILGKLPVVPVGDTETIPYCMRQHVEDFVGAAFDIHITDGAGDGRR